MGPYRDALRDLGYVEGKNIEFDVRSAQGQASRLPQLAAELVHGKVDIIVAALHRRALEIHGVSSLFLSSRRVIELIRSRSRFPSSPCP